MHTYAFFETAQNCLTWSLEMARLTSLFVTFYVLFVSLEEEVEAKETDDLHKIIGGVNANPGDIPYQIRLGTREGKLLCGGSIIDEYHFLTAAHCEKRARGSLVMVGSVDLKALDDPNRFTTELDKIFSHQLYSYATDENDIAIGRIKGKFTWTDFVKPVTIAEAVPQVGTCCEVSGWGSTHEENFSTILQKLQLPISDREKCKIAYEKLGEIIYPTMFCAGFQEGGKDAWLGDSGGPFTCNGSLVGLVSWGSSSAQPDLEGVYTDVPAYKSWIKSTLEKSYSELGESKPH